MRKAMIGVFVCLAICTTVGLSPWLALASSTIRAGEILGRSYGLTAGDEGSVVVLDASPIEDIHTGKIHLVVHGGAVVHRGAVADRDGLLAVGVPKTELAPYIWARILSMSGREMLLLGGLLVLVLTIIVLWRRFRLRRRGVAKAKPRSASSVGRQGCGDGRNEAPSRGP